MNEAFKKQMLSSHEYFQAKRWEGKPLGFKVKYFYANYPEFALCAVLFGVIAPIVCAYKYYSFPNTRKDAVKKYRANYTVVRDTHPSIKEIIEEKEMGREFFPKF